MADEQPPTAYLDLTGVPCPQNTAAALLELEFMDEGDVLDVLVDDGEPLINVPDSLKIEGHVILATTRIGDQWRLRIQRSQ